MRTMPAQQARDRAPRRLAFLRPAGTLLFIAAGGVLYLFVAAPRAADLVWLIGLLLTGVPVVVGTLLGALRGRFAADLVASLAVATAIVLNEPLAGLVIVLMQTGGEALERYAEGRASAAVRELEAAAPRGAHRRVGSRIADISAEEIRVGDDLLVRPGELIPADGMVVEGRSHVDVSRLTGEPLPVVAEAGTPLMSGSVNGEGPIVVRARAVAGESQYARIVELVRNAQATRAPIHRLADRYAVVFTPITLAVCVAAYLATRDPVRILAVLVVATPCPLILATPVAIIGGIGSAARRQIIFRTGAALEQLARVRVAVFDKTGTLTVGIPRVRHVLALPPFSEAELLRLSGAVEQGSSHVLARSVVEAAQLTAPELPPARNVREDPGRGIRGEVEGRRVSIGSLGFVAADAPAATERFQREGADGDGLRAFIVVDRRPAGVLEFADAVRPGLDHFFEALSRLGVHRTLLLSGDHEIETRAVADRLGIREMRGDLLPEDKVQIVRSLVAAGDAVLMVGDGTNDAPALSAATVGIALAGRGGGITAEAADAVVLVDDLTRIVDAARISRRTMRIARESIWVGLGLSGLAMGFAAAGMIAPTIGALLQEAIDVAVILNALRASRRLRPAL